MLLLYKIVRTEWNSFLKGKKPNKPKHLVECTYHSRYPQPYANSIAEAFQGIQLLLLLFTDQASKAKGSAHEFHTFSLKNRVLRSPIVRQSSSHAIRDNNFATQKSTFLGLLITFSNGLFAFSGCMQGSTRKIPPFRCGFHLLRCVLPFQATQENQ